MAMTRLYDKPEPNEAARTIDAAIDGGVTMIDTADAYNDGKNEELVGRTLAGRRDRERKSVGQGKRVYVRVDLGGRRIITEKNQPHRSTLQSDTYPGSSLRLTPTDPNNKENEVKTSTRGINSR